MSRSQQRRKRDELFKYNQQILTDHRAIRPRDGGTSAREDFPVTLIRRSGLLAKSPSAFRRTHAAHLGISGLGSNVVRARYRPSQSSPRSGLEWSIHLGRPQIPVFLTFGIRIAVSHPRGISVQVMFEWETALRRRERSPGLPDFQETLRLVQPRRNETRRDETIRH